MPPIISAFNSMIRLCALLGLDGLCETLVESLVKGTGLCDGEVAAPQDPKAASQVFALRALVALAGAPEIGVLGSAWTHILRCLSALDLMVIWPLFHLYRYFVPHTPSPC